MNIDIRLKLDLFEHPKLQKLRRRLGSDGVLCLLRLWLWAAANRCDGRLSGLDADDIELAARWQGRPRELVEALCDLRLLEGPFSAGGTCATATAEEPPAGRNSAEPEAGEYRIHDWCEHQAWACRSEERSARARKAAQARWGVEENKVGFQQDRTEHEAAMLVASPSNAPRAKNQEPKGKALSQSPAKHPAPAREAGQGRGVSQGAPRAEAKASATATRQGGQAGSKNARTSREKSGDRAGSQTQAQTSEDLSGGPSIPGTAGGVGLASGKSQSQGHTLGHAPGLTSGRGGAVISQDSPQPKAKPAGQEALPGSGHSTASQPREVTACEAQPENLRATALTPELLPPEPAEECQRGGAVLFTTLATVRDNSTSRASTKANGYRPPSLAEVEMYCAMRGNGLEPRRFMDWCEARGWRIGGKLVRDWRALVRRFEQREREAEALGGSGGASGAMLPALPSRLPIPQNSTQSALPQATPIPTLESAPALGFAGLRASTVHQAQMRERDLMARMILNETRNLHARQPGDSAPFGAPQPALPPEWADGV